MNPLLGKTLIRFGLFYAYALFVAWIFTLIEKRDESSHERMERKLQELRKVISQKHNMTDNDFDSFVREAAAAVLEHEELDWTFMNSCGFVFAALTTIGFGHITPKTQLGQGVTIIVCLFGIPLTMLAMNTAGELWATCIRFLVIKTETGLFKRAAPKHVKMKTFFVACALIIVLLISATGISINHLEDWGFIEGLYAWFVTFTTIGFGDYVHLESLGRKVDHGETSKARLVFYAILFELPYLVGLSLMSCILTCLVDAMDQLRHLRDRFNICCPDFTCLARRLNSSKVTVIKGFKNEDNQAYEIPEGVRSEVF